MFKRQNKSSDKELLKSLNSTFFNAKISKNADLTQDVLQEAVLEPLYYLPDINNLQNVGLKGSYKLYADEIVILHRNKSKNWLRINVYKNRDNNA